MYSPLNPIIPADWSQWSAAKPVVIEPLLGGLTNQSFLISADSNMLVLRLNSAISAALDLNRAAEAQALQLASAAKLTAELVYCDQDYRYLVTQYLAGESFLPTEQGLTQLATLLRQIHQLPAIDAVLDINAKVASYWRAISPQLTFASSLKKLDAKIHQHISHAANLSSGLCLCHNDLLVDNLIANGRDGSGDGGREDDRDGGREECSNSGNLFAIDWEYAAMADSFYELAVIVEGHNLNSSQQKHFLTSYLARPANDQEWQRLYHWRVIYRYLTLLWYAVQFSTGAMVGPSIEQQINQQIEHLSGLIEHG